MQDFYVDVAIQYADHALTFGPFASLADAHELLDTYLAITTSVTIRPPETAVPKCD